MSAVYGLLRFDAAPVAPRDMDRLGQALAYRAPDGRKHRINGAIGLGHGLLQVNGEDRFEAQPLHDREADVTLVADLRLDNREDLAAALDIGLSQLSTMPDSTLVLAAYKKWGEDCAGHLLGDFVFALWDGRRQNLVLGRDPMGQRYVHFYRGPQFLAFATDIKPLWTLDGVPRDLSDTAIGRKLVLFRGNDSGATAFEEIFGLTAGTVMTVSAAGNVTQRRYWQPQADPAHLGQSEAYYIAAYRRVLDEAVACRLRRLIRAPGLVFSGGYDSAAIAGLAGPHLAGTGRKLVAATSVMPADYRGGIRHARQWVDLCARDMPHLDVRYVTRDGKSIFSGLEQGFIDSALPPGPYDFVQRELDSTLAGVGVRLVMDGHGGDYTLNPRGQMALANLLTTGHWRQFCADLPGHLRLSGRSLLTTLKSDIVMPLLPIAWRRFLHALRRGFAPLPQDRPIQAGFAATLIAEGAIAKDGLSGNQIASPAMRQAMLDVLECLCLAPAPGLSVQAGLHGLDLTRPFHDVRVVGLALAIPEALYAKGGRNRYLACAALRDIYPPEYQMRWRRNDDLIPDFQRMAKSVEPQILAEIARMENSAMLSRYFDFGKIRNLLAARGVEDHNSGWEQETQLALHGFLVARYTEWFRQANR